MIRRTIVDVDGAGKPAVHAVELEQVRAGGDVAGEFVDVHELDIGMVAERPHDETPDAPETVDSDSGDHVTSRCILADRSALVGGRPMAG